MGEEGKGIKQKKTLIDTDSTMVISIWKGGVGEVEEGKVGINSDGRRLDFGW